MRILVASGVFLVLTACATPKPSGPDRQAEAVSQVLQIHEVSDLLGRPEDNAGVVALRMAKLTAEVRACATSSGAPTELEPSVTRHGTAIVVVATPDAQTRVSNLLSHKRAAIAPNGL